MINYNIIMRGNPTDPQLNKKAYATAQYSQVNIQAAFAALITLGATKDKQQSPSESDLQLFKAVRSGCQWGLFILLCTWIT